MSGHLSNQILEIVDMGRREANNLLGKTGIESVNSPGSFSEGPMRWFSAMAKQYYFGDLRRAN